MRGTTTAVLLSRLRRVCVCSVYTFFQNNDVISSGAYASACNELLIRITMRVVARRMHNASPIYMKWKMRRLLKNIDNVDKVKIW